MAVLLASGSLALPQTHLVHAEIVSVTSAMRKNARWSTTSAWAYARNVAKLNGESIALRRSAPTSSNNGNKSSAREPPREADLMAGFEGLKRELAHTQGSFATISRNILYLMWRPNPCRYPPTSCYNASSPIPCAHKITVLYGPYCIYHPFVATYVSYMWIDQTR